MPGQNYWLKSIYAKIFLEDYGVDASQVAVGREPNGRATAEAYALFSTLDLADRAMKEMQRKEI